MDYYQKYLKYKHKFIVERYMKGGANDISIVTFNVLNSVSYVVKMLFLAHLELLKTKYPSINPKKLGEELAILEEKRSKYRYQLLLEIFDVWYDDHKIICLQEVDIHLLELIKQKYPQVYHTDGDDVNYIYVRNQKTKTVKKEFRVIIVPNIYKVNDIKIIPLENNDAVKNGLMVNIQHNDFKFIVINIHFHYKSLLTDFELYANKISELIDVLPFIITGDFNNPLEDDKLNHFITKLNRKIETNESHLTSHDFTSHDTRIREGNPQYAIIDHILTSGFDSSNVKVIDRVKDINIFYDVKHMLDVIDPDNKLTLPLDMEDLIEKLKVRDFVSDHKPIEIKLSYGN